MNSLGKTRVLARLVWVYCALLAGSAIVLAAGSATPPRTATAASPSVEAILDKYIAAIGGIKAWKNSSTRVVKGTVQLSPPPMNGTIELYQAAPDKMLFQLKVPGLGVTWVLVNGGDGWQKDFGGEPRRLQGDELSDAKMDADFWKDVDLRKLYSRMEYAGVSTIDSQTVDMVRAYTATGRSHTLYFDRGSGLLVREDFVSISAHGPEVVQTTFGDYRELKGLGIKYPFLVEQVTGRATEIMRFENVVHNVPVNSSVFVPPNH